MYANSAVAQKSAENVLTVWGANLLAFLAAKPEAQLAYGVRLCSLVLQLLRKCVAR